MPQLIQGIVQILPGHAPAARVNRVLGLLPAKNLRRVLQELDHRISSDSPSGVGTGRTMIVTNWPGVVNGFR